MVAGTVAKPLCDKNGVSREKLAYYLRLYLGTRLFTYPTQWLGRTIAGADPRID